MATQIRVTINGSNENPWHVYGLRCNPFPQLARAEFSHANRLLRLLDSDPITSADQIRAILRGCSDEFVDLCCSQFTPGQRVSFLVHWPD